MISILFLAMYSVCTEHER